MPDGADQRGILADVRRLADGEVLQLEALLAGEVEALGGRKDADMAGVGGQYGDEASIARDGDLLDRSVCRHRRDEDFVWRRTSLIGLLEDVDGGPTQFFAHRIEDLVVAMRNPARCRIMSRSVAGLPVAALLEEVEAGRAIVQPSRRSMQHSGHLPAVVFPPVSLPANTDLTPDVLDRQTRPSKA